MNDPSLLQACTGGGCTISAQSSVRTEESIPEGVPAPIITAASPLELVVTWTHPTQPNGRSDTLSTLLNL